MSENPVSDEKVLDGLKNAEKRIRRVKRNIDVLGWRIKTFKRLYQLKLVPSMSISQSEEVSLFSATLNTILVLIQTIALGVSDLERQTLGTALNAEKDSKNPTTTKNE